MAKIKLTKNELRAQQTKLNQLLKYLPTLQLKKALLQAEVTEARLEIAASTALFNEKKNTVTKFSALLTESLFIPIEAFAVIDTIEKRYENIAGIEIPYFVNCTFKPIDYTLFDTPIWLEGAVVHFQDMIRAQEKVLVSKEKSLLLEQELREISIRVNLFEKVLIPRAQSCIKRIKIFLGDQQLAAVSQAKVAKLKIEERKSTEYQLEAITHEN